MDYLAYGEYLEMGGDKTLPVDDFRATARDMKQRIDYYTFKRLNFEDEETKTEVKSCIFNMVQEAIKDIWKSENMSTNIASETVGRHSVSYKTFGVAEVKEIEKAKDKALYEIIKRYFGLSGAMYKGVSK